MSSRLLKQLFALCFNHRIPFLPPPPLASLPSLFPLALTFSRSNCSFIALCSAPATDGGFKIEGILIHSSMRLLKSW